MFTQINEKAENTIEQKGPCMWCDESDTCADLGCIWCDEMADDFIG